MRPEAFHFRSLAESTRVLGPLLKGLSEIGCAERCFTMTDQALSGDVIGHFRWRSVHEELVEQARDVVNGLSTDELRQDANLRKCIADEIDQLRVAVDGALEDLPRRKIRIAA